FINLWGKNKRKEHAIQFEHLWMRYLSLTKCCARVLLLFSLYSMCIFALYLGQLFEFPSIPYRGGFSYYASSSILVSSVFVYLLLIFMIVDVTRLNDRLIWLLTNNKIIWPNRLVESYCTKYAITKEIAADKILLDFIIKRSNVIDKLVFFPFFILFLMILSRSYYFDNWHVPIPVEIIIACTSLIAISSVIRLRGAAKKARSHILERLDNHYWQALTNESNKENTRTDNELTESASRIKLLADEINTLNKGPFSPLTHHPVIRAIAMPFGGVGGLYLIEHFASIS
ncbi:MAG: hypothetical protein OEX11_07815, partial [Nitrosomonas sp.]|nr:hypothetical protein [Nitrosomonas sp.]